MPHHCAAGGDRIWRPTRLAIYARDGWRCAACPWEPPQVAELRRLTGMLGDLLTWGWPIQPGLSDLLGDATKGMTLDHVVPPSRGGGHRPDNLVTLCLSCNSSKQDTPLRTWRPDIMRAVRRQVRQAVAPALGRALCDELYPTWRETEHRRTRERRRRPAESAFEFFEQLAAGAA